MDRLGDILALPERSHSAPAPVPPSLCPHCGGAGVLRNRQQPQPWKPDAYRRCECAVARDQQADEAERLRHSGLTELERFTLSTFEHDERRHRTLREAYHLACHYAEHPDGWLYLYGPFGSGKTHLAVAIGWARHQAGDQVVFTNVEDMLDDFRRSFSPQSGESYHSLFERVKTATVLILDDYGATAESHWGASKMFQILDQRSRTRRPTILTSNLAPRDIEPRLRSRISESGLCRQILFPKGDNRLGITL